MIGSSSLENGHLDFSDPGCWEDRVTATPEEYVRKKKLGRTFSR